MKNITKSAEVIGKVLGLIMGAGFTTPTNKFIEKNYYNLY